MNRIGSFSVVRRLSVGSRWARAAALVSAGLAYSSMASAAPQTLIARQGPADISTFTLDFGDFGGERQANITATEFRLELDAEAGTARFVSYLQHVDPLLLPGDISTGNITVEIVPGSSTGFYDPEIGDFTTTEFYAVHFDGDLSAYGLESPVYLPSTSLGTVIRESTFSGAVQLNWDGVGQLDNPFDPQTPIVFTYACNVEAAFGPRPVAPEQTNPTEAALRASEDGDKASDESPAELEPAQEAESTSQTVADE